MIDRFLTLSAVLGGAAWAAQPSAPSPIAAPLRELPWGQLNFLHTTDTHGWHGGHLQEASYSADWGDYISFASHMRAKADADGVDLLVVDTGDRVEGNGLYDASDPKGKYTFDVLPEQHIDLMCTGNHELYKANSSFNELNVTVPAFNGSYIASNLDIYNPDTGVMEPLAQRYKKFTTPNQGIRVLAMGFLYDFTGNANNTVVQKVKDAIKEDWFQTAIRDRDVDLFVIIGHVGLRTQEFQLLYKTIRSQQWDTPIHFFGGHTHIRDYRIWDNKAVGLESGRYMETIGFASVDGLNRGGKKMSSSHDDDVDHHHRELRNVATLRRAGLSFNRRYIDNNLFSLYHHSGTDAHSFPTDVGRNVSARIASARAALHLDARRGCAPHNFWLNRAPYPSRDSLLSWLAEAVLPAQLGADGRVTAANRTALAITNSGALRFDVFKGAFTRDSAFAISPFTSGFRALPDVPRDKAERVLPLLNHGGPLLDRPARALGLDPRLLAPPEQGSGRLEVAAEVVAEVDEEEEEEQQQQQSRVEGRAAAARGGRAERGQEPLADARLKLTPGYTTKDDAGDDGDDTLHEKITFYSVPNCVQSVLRPASPAAAGDADVVDVVYNEFIEGYVVLALKYLGVQVEAADAVPWADGKSLTAVIAEWVGENWGVEGEEEC
ncbi:Metallo-dependent phosphatase-like protein [Lineolata rhizophorae]|uniref:Metallo-dependent phosphatase-like protein n=1 Tax=Lineolata rhizophorae TaxID=578093 RepID=A0A6A6P1W1_9PEZI|nr:Metallo-dependent phosphatase-like protein [Lineolata rhizophorae]